MTCYYYNIKKVFGFTENQDFVIIESLRSPDSGSAKARPQNVKEYHLTIDMAKELSMVERNEKGKQALGLRPKDIFELLKDLKWMYKRTVDGRYKGFQDKINAGYLRTVMHVVETETGIKSYDQIKITPKGITKLAEIINLKKEA